MRDKQIEEMAKVIHQAEMEDMMLKVTGDIDYLIDAMPMNVYVAQELYNKGYRKASDVARDIITDVIEILNDEYVRCNKWEAHIILTITQKVAELKKKYESEGADDEG